MIDIILRSAARFLIALLLLFSVFLLLRGHNTPGGGFVGGLVAAAAFSLYSIAYDVSAARQVLRVDSRTLIGAGLLIALGSGVLSLFRGEPFMTGQWGSAAIQEVQVYLGSPLIFDVGVYVTVLGVTLTIILSLAEE